MAQVRNADYVHVVLIGGRVGLFDQGIGVSRNSSYASAGIMIGRINARTVDVHQSTSARSRVRASCRAMSFAPIANSGTFPKKTAARRRPSLRRSSSSMSDPPLPPEAAVTVAAVPVAAEFMPHPGAFHDDRRRTDRIRGIRVSRPSAHNADSDGSLCLVWGHCQHAQQRDYGKSDFFQHLFHPPIHSTRQGKRST